MDETERGHMNQQVALITGGAKGIGRGIALDLAAKKWNIAFCYRASDAEAQKTAQAIIDRGGQALPIRCDVSNPVACKNMVAQIEKEWGQIDVLINGAGPYHRINLFDETIEGWNEMFDGNLHPIFYLAQAVAPGMKARKAGRIISFSMANADQMEAQPDVTGHYIAKAGVLILTRTLAKLLAPYGITVNAISPGFIDSGSAPAQELAAMTKRIPAGYIGTVDDTVAAVRYLLSEEARYVNGANIQISGGWGL
jgi:3-oxoacyl-[acyl-carrier protein] reductase